MNAVAICVFAICLLLCDSKSWGQQVIGSFTYMDGGFESQTVGALGTSLSTTAWSRQSQSGASSSISSGTPRSGSRYATVTNVATVSRGLQSPQTATAANGPSLSSQYVVQFYVRNASSVNSFQAGVTTNGTTNPSYSTASTLSANADWEKQTFALTTTATAITTAGIGVIGRSAAGSFDVDDFVIYAGSSTDNSAPLSPGTVSITNQTTTSLDVSWSAASGGVDGGGYVVVRYSTNPNADNDPNQNGIYAVGNTLTNGTGGLTGTVRYIGTGTSFTDNVGLSSGTTYYYKVYTVDKAFNYSAESSGNGSTTSGCVTPSTQPSSFTSNTITASTANIAFTRGDGDNVIVIARAASAVTTNPTSGSSYLANPQYASGDLIGSGYVVYNGAAAGASSATGDIALTGLSAGTTYHFAAYEYSNTGVCYNTTSPLTGSFTTFPATPTPSAATNMATTSFTANWGSVTGATGYRLDVSTAIDFSSFVTGFNDLAVAAITKSVTGLIANTTYYYRVRAENGSGASASSSTITTSTLAAQPSSLSSAISFGSQTVNSIPIASWTQGDGSNRIVIIRTGSAVAPANGTDYAVSSTTGTGNTVIFNGSGNGPVTASSLSAGTQYTFDIYEYNGSGVTANYGSAYTTTKYTLQTEPVSHSATFTATSISTTSLTLNFTTTGASGLGYLIVYKQGASAFVGTPVDGSGYAAGNPLGDGTIAAFVTANSTTTANITGLTVNTQYTFSIIPFGRNSTNAESYNYYTGGVIPTVTLTTLSTAPTAETSIF